MAKKGFLLGMLALALTFGLALTGCDVTTTEDEDAGYTFKVKVDNYHSSLGTITKIEFINGNTQNDKVVKTYTGGSTPYGSRSEELVVSGFTVEAGTGTRYCGVKVYNSTGTFVFGYGAFGHESKILATIGGTNSGLHAGNW
jgi:hypothetical protein